MLLYLGWMYYREILVWGSTQMYFVSNFCLLILLAIRIVLNRHLSATNAKLVGAGNEWEDDNSGKHENKNVVGNQVQGIQND